VAGETTLKKVFSDEISHFVVGRCRSGGEDAFLLSCQDGAMMETEAVYLRYFFFQEGGGRGDPGCFSPVVVSWPSPEAGVEQHLVELVVFWCCICQPEVSSLVQL